MIRRVALLLAIATSAIALAGAPADAGGWSDRFERLAIAEAIRTYDGWPGAAPVWPPDCNAGREVVDGVLLLPANAGIAGDVTVHCKANGARSALVDLGGYIVTEDDNGVAGGWEINEGEFVPFWRRNLERICNDVMRELGPNGTNVFPGPAMVTYHGTATPITGTAIVTDQYFARIDPTNTLYYAESVTMNHPGRLAARYCGYKALVPLGPGTTTITVDLTAIYQGSTVLTYVIER